MKHKLSIFALLVLIIAFNTYPTFAQINSPRLSITTIPTENLQVVGSNGVRGAAAAVLDENYYLAAVKKVHTFIYLIYLQKVIYYLDELSQQMNA